MVEYLIHKGVNLKHEDKKGLTPSHWAKKHNKQQLLELLLQHGAVAVTDNKKSKTGSKKVVNEESKEKVNERKLAKRYLLTRKRENGNFEPLTDEEFEQFRL
jgi:ankyrin repeat protein